MIGRIGILTLAIPLAWHFGPDLLEFLGWIFPVMLAVIAFFAPENVLGHSAEYYLRFALAIAIFWVFLKAGWAFVSFGFPWAQRFGAVKEFRRLQGIVTEIVLFGSVFLVVFSFFYIDRGDKSYFFGRTPVEEAKAKYLDTVSDRAGKKYDELCEKYIRELVVQDRLPGAILYEPGLYITLAEKEIERLHREEYSHIPFFMIESKMRPLMLARQREFYAPLDKEIAAAKKERDAADAELSLLDTAAPAYDMRSVTLNFRERLGGVYNNLFWEIISISFVVYLLLNTSRKRFLGPIYVKIIEMLEKAKFGLGGSARFASMPEEWVHKWEKGQLFLGRSFYNPKLHLGLGGESHMVTIGASRAGKGSTVIVNNLLLWDGSCIIIDPKGTNAAVTAERRRAMGHDVRIIDPFNILGGGEKYGFNPLGDLDLNSPTLREDIEVITGALVTPDTSGRVKDASHWEEGASTIISGVQSRIISVVKKPSLPLLRDVLNLTGEQKDIFWEAMKSHTGGGGLALDAAALMLGGKGSEELQNFLSNARKHTRWLGSPLMRQILSAPTDQRFDFKSLKENPTTVYLVMPPVYLDVHRRFVRLFINTALMSIPRGGRSKIPILMMMDEFQQLSRMDEVIKAFRLLAGYNLVMWPFIQDYAGFVHMYGADAASMLGNTRGVQMFGVSDPEGREYASEKLGKRTLKYAPGVDSTRTAPLRESSEVAKELDVESMTQYVFRGGRAPLILDRVKYYEDKLGGRWWLKGLNLLVWPGSLNWLFRKFYPFKGMYADDPDYK